MHHYNITFKPDNKTVSIHQGAKLMEAASKAGIILNAVCGGKGTCGKCSVELVDTGQMVYACEYEIDGDLLVKVPDKSRFYKQQILEHGIENQIKVNPCVRKDCVVLEKIDEQSIKNNLNHLCNEHDCDFQEDIISSLKSEFDQDAQVEVTFVSHISNYEKSGKSRYKIVSYEMGDTSEKIYGVAVDIGTTTVVAKLVDMKDGKVLAVEAVDNPQSTFGADVIARIGFGSQEDGLQKMHDCIIKAVNELIGLLTSAASISCNDIYEVCAACNTTMNHIFLNFPIIQLGQKPFKAYREQAQNINAVDLNIGINPAGNIHAMANIAGFVGADTTAVALAVGMDKTDKMTLVMDIGTNGELIVGTKDKMVSASCAAGPAFEGAKIQQGSRAIDGAIQSVVINHEDIDIDVIGGGIAKSICGSGLIDAMAVLVELGIIDMTGRFVDKQALAGKLPEKITNRIVEIDGESAFLLADNSVNNNENVYFTQRDVRETQLAKAAMRVGIVILQKELGIDDSEIDQVLLAGAFGNYVRRESAKKIGLIPDIDISKIRFVGNAASTGAVMSLLSCECRELASRLAEEIGHIELADSPEFSMIYAECMMFNQV